MEKACVLKNGVSFLGIQETAMTTPPLFKIRSVWGNFNVEFDCSSARGNSGGILLVWDLAS